MEEDSFCEEDEYSVAAAWIPPEDGSCLCGIEINNEVVVLIPYATDLMSFRRRCCCICTGFCVPRVLHVLLRYVSDGVSWLRILTCGGTWPLRQGKKGHEEESLSLNTIHHIAVRRMNFTAKPESSRNASEILPCPLERSARIGIE